MRAHLTSLCPCETYGPRLHLNNYLRARGELFDLLLKNYRGSGSQRFIAFAAALPHPLQMNFAGLISAFTSSYFALFFIISQMWLSCPSCGIVFTLIITKSKAYKPTLCACSRRWRQSQEHSYSKENQKPQNTD